MEEPPQSPNRRCCRLNAHFCGSQLCLSGKFVRKRIINPLSIPSKLRSTTEHISTHLLLPLLRFRLAVVNHLEQPQSSGQGGPHGTCWKSPSKCTAHGGHGLCCLGTCVYGRCKRLVLAEPQLPDLYRE